MAKAKKRNIISDLPEELLDSFFEYLEIGDVSSFRLVSSFFGRIGIRYIYRVCYMSLTPRGVRKPFTSSNDPVIARFVKHIVLEDVMPKDLGAHVWPRIPHRHKNIFRNALASSFIELKRKNWSCQIDIVVDAVDRLHNVVDIEYCHGFKHSLLDSQNVLNLPPLFGRPSRRTYLGALTRHKVNEALYEATDIEVIEKHQYSRFKLFHSLQEKINSRSRVKRIKMKLGHDKTRDFGKQAYASHLQQNVEHLDMVFDTRMDLISPAGSLSMLGVGVHTLTNLTTLSLIGKSPAGSKRLNLRRATVNGVEVSMPFLHHLKDAHFENCFFSSGMLEWLHRHPATFSLKNNVFPPCDRLLKDSYPMSKAVSIKVLGAYIEDFSLIAGRQPPDFIWLLGTKEEAIEKAHGICFTPDPPPPFISSEAMSRFFMDGGYPPHNLLNIWKRTTIW